MFTPRRPMKRQLVFTPASTFKRARTSTAVRSYRASAKRYQRGVSTRGPLSQQVKALQRYVAKLKPEIKYHDTSASAANVTTAGAVDHITDIAQGDTMFTRTGNSVTIVSLTIKGTIIQWANSGVHHYRVAVVQDKQQIQDTSPTAANIFTDAVSSANPVTAVPNLANLERFNVLWMSKPYQNNMMAVPANSNNYYEFTRKMNLKVSFNGTASSDIEKNGLYIVFLTDDPTNTVDFNGLARLGFTDA